MTLRDEVRALLCEHADPPADDAAEWKLESLQLVVIAEALEERFGLRVGARELLPANFGSVDNIVGFVGRKRAGG
jgi:acyl carrier protein